MGKKSLKSAELLELHRSKIKNFPERARIVTIVVPPDHTLVELRAILDWDKLEEIASTQRARALKMPQVGRKPHLRAMLGVLILRALKSWTLQDTMDFVRNYAPARVFCGLIDENGVDSGLKPDFRTISDFERMMGEEGISQINAVLLRAAIALGFSSINSLAADTTAQEAAIPYPTEVGLMRSFARSVANGVSALSGLPRKVKKEVVEIYENVCKEVRKYRLFAKNLTAKRKVGSALLKLTSTLHTSAQKILEMAKRGKNSIKAKSPRFLNRLPELLETFLKLMPQIKYFIKNGRPCKNKIISLDQPDARSIPRGKDGKKVEFGYKWGVNRIRNGYIWLYTNPKLGNVSEYDCAVKAVQEHIALFGRAPNDFAYDRGGWSKPHIKKIQDLGVKRAAVAPTGRSKWLVTDRCRKKMVRERAQVEGNIGCLKRVGFNRPKAKDTQGCVIYGHKAALRLNLTKLVNDIKSAH